MEAPPPLPPRVLKAIGEPGAELLRRLLAKEPAARFTSAATLGAALDACLSAPPAQTATAPTPSKPSLEKPRAAMAPWLRLLFTPSEWAWRSRITEYVEARRRRRRLRAAFAWPVGLIERLHGLRKQQRLLGPPSELARRLRDATLRAARGANRKRIGIAAGVVTAVAVSCALLWAWRTSDDSSDSSLDRPSPSVAPSTRARSGGRGALPPSRPSSTTKAASRPTTTPR
jgi:hypothetical protein